MTEDRVPTGFITHKFLFLVQVRNVFQSVERSSIGRERGSFLEGIETGIPMCRPQLFDCCHFVHAEGTEILQSVHLSTGGSPILILRKGTDPLNIV